MRSLSNRRVHFIEKLGLFDLLRDGTYESKYWPLTEAIATAQVGGDIYFHQTKAKPSFFGGTILGYRVQPDGEYQNRIIFRLKSEMDHKGVLAGPEGWQFAMKIVMPQ